MPHQPRTSRASRRRRWLLGSASIILSLVAVEIFLHVFSALSPHVNWLLSPPTRQGPLLVDAELGHRGNPGYYTEHDAWGFRNERVPDTADLVVLGDSQTYGDGTSRSGAWPQQLSALTGQSVYNMGMGGWGPVHYHAMLEQALRLRPQVVIVGFYFGNDLYDAFAASYRLPVGRDYIDPVCAPIVRMLDQTEPLEARIAYLARASLRNAPGLPPTDDPALTKASLPILIHNPIRGLLSDHSKLYGLVRAGKQRLGPTTERPASHQPSWSDWKQWATTDRPQYISAFNGPPARTIFTPSYRGLAVDADEPRIVEGLAVSMRALAAIAGRCQEAGCRFMVVLIPTKETVFAPSVPSPEKLPGYAKLLRDEASARRGLVTFLRARQVPVVDVTQALRKGLTRDAGVIYPPSADGHPRRAGYEAIARIVAERLP